jgi:hypothetical protein
MTKPLHPSDSTEQQLAHKEILSLLNEKYQLKLEGRKVLINDVFFQVDDYLENPSILCAIYSHISKIKVAQHNKICKAKSKRVISDEMAKDANKYLRDVACRLCINTLFDPKLYQALLTKGAYHFENGIIRYSKWSKKMIEENGEKIRPMLNSIWNELIKNATFEQKLTEGAFHFRNGITRYSQWSDTMIHKYGDKIKWELKFIWDEIQKDNTLKQTGNDSSLKNKAGANNMHTDVNIGSKTSSPALSMYCPNCGNGLIVEQINFCPVCGQDLNNFKQQAKSKQNNIPTKNNTSPSKVLQPSFVKEFLKAKFHLIRKSSLNDWLEYLWHHILPITIIILLIILLINQCDFTKHNSFPGER